MRPRLAQRLPRLVDVPVPAARVTRLLTPAVRRVGGCADLCQTRQMPMRKFQHTVSADDTSAQVGSGDLDVLATPRLITWCENAAFQVCKQNIDDEHTTVGTMVRIEHVRGSAVGSEVTVLCAEPINDGRRLVCHVTVRDADGEEIAKGEIHRAVVDPDRFMSKCQRAV